MSLLINAAINLLRLLRNARRALRRPPEFVWISATGALPEFEPPRRGLLRRRLDPRTLAPTLEELRAELDRFREQGKKVAAYLVDADTRSYYLATVADEVFATPLATLNLVGLRTRVNFLKDALGRLGLETEVLAVSPYKSAADPVARSDFSPEAREQVERLLDARFDEVVAAVSASRGLTPGEVREYIDHAPYSATEAVQRNLIDDALYEDELAGRLSGDGAKGLRLAELEETSRSLRLPYRGR